MALTPRLYNRDWTLWGEPPTYLSATVEWRLNELGMAVFEVDWDQALYEWVKGEALAYRPVLVAMTHQGVRWTGSLRQARRTMRDGQQTLTLSFQDEWRWLSRMRFWASPGAPIEAQIPPSDVQVGPAKTVLTHYLDANARRLGLPMVVVPAPAGDTSPTLFTMSRMAQGDTFVAQHLKDTDLQVTARRYFPGEDTPTGVKLARPTVFVAVEDPRPRRHVRWGTYAMTELDEVIDACTGTDVIVGGKSPDWINRVFTDVFPTFGPALRDLFLAFLRYRDQDRVAAGGVELLGETFASGGGDALTLDALYAALQAAWDTRARSAATFTVQDGMPWTFGTEAVAGEASYLLGDLTTDWTGAQQQVSSVVVKVSPDGETVTPSLGAPRDSEDPRARDTRRVKEALDRLDLNSLYNT